MMKAAPPGKRVPSSYARVAAAILFLLGVHQLITGFIHAYTDKIIMEKKDVTLAVLWSLAAFGNRQLFIGFWEVMVSLDWGGTRLRAMRPLLGLHALMGGLYQLSPLIHGRYLSEFSPNAPGTTLPYFLLVLSVVGYICSVVEQQTADSKST